MKLCVVVLISFVLSIHFPFLTQAAPVIESDVCVYGATSGGVVAAVAAARHGKSVVLASFNNHVGGMTSGGLGVTDYGNTNSIAGIAREFYLRVGRHYGSSNQVYLFEPHVAEETFLTMLNEAKVPVFTNQRLASVTMTNQRISKIVMDDGTTYRAKMFIDTTYEGDLMAMAGVTWTIGREGVNVYNESLAGLRPLHSSYDYSPYVVPQNAGAGLLPFVQARNGGALVGEGDNRVQAYNFRLCLTRNPTNQIPILPPSNYSEADYELFARYLEARVAKDGTVNLKQLIHLQPTIPNGKADINANQELSTDLIGYSSDYPTNTYAGREVIRQKHEDYIRGFLHFLATSSRVPLNVRTQMQSWALAKDEFQDTGGWPHQLYVREARRMVSDYVMVQQNAYGQRVAPDPIALASYMIDSHGCQRVAVGNFTRWEGSIGGLVPYPYGISYQSIIPRAGECENLFCTFALSASHVGFASIRMEPVFMMISQSAASAAALAMDDNVPVQQVNYQKLSAMLRADGQLLEWMPSNNAGNEIIIDQSDPSAVTKSSGWSKSTNPGGWNEDYFYGESTGKGNKWIRYTPNLPTNGTYEVYLWWVKDSNRSTNTPVDIIHAGGISRVLVNQKVRSGGWFKVFVANFNSGTTSGVIIRNKGTPAGTYVVADAVRFLPTGNTPQPPSTVEVVASDAVAGEFGTNMGRFSIVRNRGANLLPLTVNFTVSGAACNGVDYLSIPSSVTIAAGAAATNIIIAPFLDGLVEGDETVTIALTSSTNYVLTSVSNATMVIRDLPMNSESQKSKSTLVEP